ncbi:MAG: STY4851/ECs_5259 family protein [Pyrinomonadaceae bacterium]
MTQTNENMTLAEWTMKMLSKHQLVKPDGRHLYQYRITDAEFNLLETILRGYIDIGQSYLGFAELVKRPNFPPTFVLYGAEWWRRRYDGSGFSWEGILHDLGANADQWNQAQRSECVRNGLRIWKLKALDGIGFKYLGAIALEGGLPMKSLAAARGGIGHLLGRVLRTANNRTVILADIQNWVESLQHYLPKSYRQPAIFTLLAETAWTVLNLKQTARLDSGRDAVARLDQTIPDWRNQFPLPIEDSQAQSLIEQLVREAANVRVPKPSVCLPVERFLEFNEEKDEWRLSSVIELPEVIEAQKIAGLFEIEPDDLPRFAELSVTAGENYQTAQIRKMAWNGSYRLEDATWSQIGQAAQSEHLLRLNTAEGRVWTASAMRGQALDDDLPWVFSIEDSIYRFAGQGTVGVAGDEAVATIPKNWKISEASADNSLKIGSMKSPLRDIYRITGVVWLEDESGSRCKIGVANAASETESYEWRGQRLWLDFQSPSVAYRGNPKLYRVDDDGNAVMISNSISCKALGSQISNHWLGPVTMSYQPNGELKHRSRMTLLPENARLTMKFGDALSGAVIFDGWQASSVIVETPDVNFSQQTEGDSLILKLSVAPDKLTPKQVFVKLFWRQTSTPVRLLIPFPSKGVRAFDSYGQEISSDASLAYNQLLGTRLNILGVDRTKKITLNIQNGITKLGRKYYLQALPGAVSLDVRLTDYLTDFDHLLSLDDSPDAKVKVSIKIGEEEFFRLVIARYASLIEREESFVVIKTNAQSEDNQFQSKESSVVTMRLEDARIEPEFLTADSEISEGSGKWLFSPETREPGSWLIYPAPGATLNFRPTLWFVPGEFEAEGELACAINIADQNERHKKIKDLVKIMAEDFAHPSWQEVSRLADLIGHLPLATLDLWRKFARSASAMAALAFRCGKLPNGFVSRFEKELPFAWEAIPFSVWKKAIRQSYDYCHQVFPEDIARMTFESHTQRRINILGANHGGLSFLLGLASMEFFPEKQSEAQLLRTLGDFAREQLFVGENSLLMNLRRIQGDREWVEDEEGQLEKRWTDERIGRYRHKENYGFQNPVIAAPLLLAAEAAIGKSSTWLKDPAKIHLLRTFRAFDPEWFDEAYNWTVVRCLADGLLDEAPAEAD